MIKSQIKNKSKENGQVMLTFLVGLGMLSLSFPLWKLAQLSLQYEWQSLRQANIALITWSLARFPGRDEKRNSRPGELVMPDKDAPDAKVGAGTQDSTAKIGRLPWKTLGVPPLMDADGELLWYSVSSRFRDNGQHIHQLQCKGLRQLTIVGMDKDKPGWHQGISAVVIAPHRALIDQRRGSALEKTQAYQYIESRVPGKIATAYFRPFIQGKIIKEGRIMANDSLSPIMCAALHRGLERRRENEKP